MDAGSLCKVLGSTVLVVAAGVGVKLLIDYIKKDVDLDLKAATFDSNEYKKKLKELDEIKQGIEKAAENIEKRAGSRVLCVV